MLHGRIKWYDESKGYGLIVPEQGDKEVIFQKAVLQGFAVVPATDDPVTYEPVDPRRGTEAAKVHPA